MPVWLAGRASRPPLPQPAPVVGKWGAIAYSPATGHVGFSSDMPTAGEAEKWARRRCIGTVRIQGEERLRVYPERDAEALCAQDAWVALAASADGFVNMGWGYDKEKACMYAVTGCNQTAPARMIWCFHTAAMDDDTQPLADTWLALDHAPSLNIEEGAQ